MSAVNFLGISHDHANELAVDLGRLLDVNLHAGGSACHSVS
jgi:hypothetical protein